MRGRRRFLHQSTLPFLLGPVAFGLGRDALAAAPAAASAPGGSGTAAGSRSVRDFGAILDGKSDDTSAVRAALALANDSGQRLTFDGRRCMISGSLELEAHANFVLDFGACEVLYTGDPGSALFDLPAAGNVDFRGGTFHGSGRNVFCRLAGSAKAQGVVYPSIPPEAQWARQLRFEGVGVSNFDIAFDFQNFSRELWISRSMIANNRLAIQCSGKVVNLFVSDSVLYSATPGSQALRIRGDAGDAAWRYAEGISLTNIIADTIGTPIDLQDVYLFRFSGGQARAHQGGVAIEVTKGLCPLTRDLFFGDLLVQGALRVGRGVKTQFPFYISCANLAFNGVPDTAVVIEDNVKGFALRGASFTSPTGEARTYSVGATCALIRFEGLQPDASGYRLAPRVDPSSARGVSG